MTQETKDLERVGWELPVHTRRTRYLETLIWVLSLSLAQGVRLKGTGGRASDRHSRSERASRDSTGGRRDGARVAVAIFSLPYSSASEIPFLSVLHAIWPCFQQDSVFSISVALVKVRLLFHHC